MPASQVPSPRNTEGARCPLQSLTSGSSSQSPHHASQPPACGQSLAQNSSVQKKVACHSTKRQHSVVSVLVQAAPAPAMMSSSRISYELCIVVFACWGSLPARCRARSIPNMHWFGCRPRIVASVLFQPIGLPLVSAWRFDFETQMWRGEVDVRLVVRICAFVSQQNPARRPARSAALTSGTALHAAPCIFAVAAAPFLSRATVCAGVSCTRDV